VRGATGSDILASIARYAIIIYAVFAALTELGIAVQLTAPTFLIILGAIALAVAIAFGWGGRDVAKDLIERYYDRREKVTSGGTAGSEGGEFGTDRPSAHPLRRE
jgi:hypothetical protein